MTRIITREYTCVCRFCGDTFTAKYPHAKFCVPAHRQAMWRWRKKLPYLYNQSAYWIRQFDAYLRFPDSRPHAIEFLKEIKAVIDQMYRDNNVKVIR